MGGVKLTGLDEFVKIFGNVTVLNVIEIILAGIFLFILYKKVKKYLIDRYEENRVRDEQLQEALAAIAKYPEYREQSLVIQQQLKNDISALKNSINDLKEKQEELKQSQHELQEHQLQMEELANKRERNKTRDRLLEIYRYYTSDKYNPKKEWSKMESEAFWELFGDYEEAGGDGYMHSEVQPAMNLLTVVDIEKR